MGLSFGLVVGAPEGDSLVGAPVGDTVVWSVVTCVGGFTGVGIHLEAQRCGRHGRSPEDYNKNPNNSLNVGMFANISPLFVSQRSSVSRCYRVFANLSCPVAESVGRALRWLRPGKNTRVTIKPSKRS